ncbi:hypothetical protein ABMA28_016195 [Loxostege sticticalis]|uniref:TNFR-Cys domain-containing protein n=1 Tax=Loxostege sticticalis TaxID=481309 RepID=A0ABD0TAY2_LOXSC
MCFKFNVFGASSATWLSMRVYVVLWASSAAWLSMLVYGQTTCTEDSQCPVGFYCEKQALSCQKCLSCEDYKRESPLQRELCVTSVVQCGDCFEGLVEDLRMDRACVSPLGAEASGMLPTYVWAIIGLVVLGVTLLAIVYVVLKKDTLFQYILKIRATTSVHSARAEAACPSAPELAPPPYDELFVPPPHNGAPLTADVHVIDEDARPFIKRVPSTRARGDRESAASQAARPFNTPAYVRGPHTSYIQGDKSEPESPPFTPHDEDTMESLWTPNENTNNVISNTNSNAVAEGAGAAGDAAAGEARAHSPTDDGPPAKALCVREDTNDNRGRDAGNAGASAGAGAGSAHAPTVVISVINNFNSFEQRNSLNLPRH